MQDDQTEPTHDPRAELSAMAATLEALEGLPKDSAQRVLTWAGATLGLTLPQPGRPHPHPHPHPHPQAAPGVQADVGEAVDEHAFGHEDLASFFAASGAKSGPERALVVAYWLQDIDKKDPWLGADLNSELKNLGHQLVNVTATLNGLMGRKPQPVLQVSKGKSKKGRKAYRLSVPGLQAVRKMFETDADQQNDS
jgi:hypothetical protein